MIICGNDWGIGVNIYSDGNSSYGFPESKDPNMFIPDFECCTEQEIKNWEQAKEKLKNGN